MKKKRNKRFRIYHIDDEIKAVKLFQTMHRIYLISINAGILKNTTHTKM